MVGYAVSDICDEPGCDAEIDRGLAYVCGGMHDGGEHGCGHYYCYEHLYYGAQEQYCERCLKQWEKGYCAECGEPYETTARQCIYCDADTLTPASEGTENS